MKMFREKLFSAIAGLTIFMWSCSSGTKLDNPTQGEVTIAADESFKPLVDELTSAYEGIYPKTHFNIDYKPEQEAILQLLQDSARIIFSTRELNEKEKGFIKQQKSFQKAQHIAIDGIALVVGKDNTDSLVTIAELEGIFKGKIKSWSELANGNQDGLITLVFDNINASNLNYLMRKFGLKSVDHIRVIAAGGNEQVINLVRENPGYLGFIGVNWISNGHQLKSVELSKGIRVLGVSESAAPKSITEYIQPFQAGLELRKYPLNRDLYIISREGFSGLGGGLMTYVARDVGGLIIQKIGLIPIIPYPRELEITTDKNF